MRAIAANLLPDFACRLSRVNCKKVGTNSKRPTARRRRERERPLPTRGRRCCSKGLVNQPVVTNSSNRNSPQPPMRHAFLRCSCEPAPKWIALVFSLSLLCTASVLAQDAVRPSLAGEAAAEARRQDVDRIPYNLLLGPIRFRVSASVGVEYNDNINFADVNTQDDVIIRPNLTLDAIWPITQLNTLRLDLGIG